METALEDRLGQYATLQRDHERNYEPFCIVWTLENGERAIKQVYDLHQFWSENKTTADGTNLCLGSNLGNTRLDELKKEGRLVAVLINLPEGTKDFVRVPPDCLLYHEYKRWDKEKGTFTDLKEPVTYELKDSCVIGRNQALYLKSAKSSSWSERPDGELADKTNKKTTSIIINKG